MATAMKPRLIVEDFREINSVEDIEAIEDIAVILYQGKKYLLSTDAARIFAMKVGSFNPDTVKQYATELRIPGATKYGKFWLIPIEWVAEKQPIERNKANKAKVQKLLMEKFGRV